MEAGGGQDFSDHQRICVKKELSELSVSKKTHCPTYREGTLFLFSMGNLFFEAISEDWIIHNKYKRRFLNAALITWKLEGHHSVILPGLSSQAVRW